MAIAKAVTGKDIVNGLATVCAGKTTQTYDNTQRTQHWASGDSLQVLTNINSRFLRHGGTGGSGNWEH